MYYVFKSKKLSRFIKCKSLQQAKFHQPKESLIYRKAKGIPNPWYVHPIVDGKVDTTQIIKL